MKKAPVAHNQTIGRWGEENAARYLQEHGYEIVDKNARTPYGEIDLVARRDGGIVFVEVKTRTSRRFGLPEEAITPRKQVHMLAAAEHYAADHGINSWQVDVLAIEGTPGKTPLIEHFENVLS